MTKYLLIALLLFQLDTFSQKSEARHRIDIAAGRSVHGSGDSRGLNFSVEYRKKIKPRLFWTASIGGTINDGAFTVLYEYPAGVQNDGSARYTTAGCQLMAHMAYDLIKSDRHEILIRLGPLIRYQSSSYPDVVTALYPGATGLPFPVIVFQNDSPLRTLAAGGSTQIAYAYLTKKNLSFGVLGGFQFDSNGDNLSHISLTAGIRF